MSIKLAIVHDYLTQRGGAERVVLAMAEAFPEAPVFTSIYSPEETFDAFSKKEIRTTYLQAAYSILKNYRLLLPFYPKAFEGIDLNGYDVILSSSSSFAKGVKRPEGAVHISYCHNPTRFIWMKERYLAEEKKAPLKNWYISLFLDRLREWDLKAARGVDYFISNSLIVQERVRQFYRRESAVIYPPVECERFSHPLHTGAGFSLSDKEEGYYLVVSRLLAHKRIDIAIKAFSSLGLRLKIVGLGPQYAALKEIASGNIEFLGGVEEKELVGLYSRCTALIYPQEEDFGIAPLEANSCGKPVIAFGRGGVLETMRPDETAVFFYRQTPQDLIGAVKKFEGLRFNPMKLRENALQFDKSVFISKIKAKVEEVLKTYEKM